MSLNVQRYKHQRYNDDNKLKSGIEIIRPTKIKQKINTKDQLTFSIFLQFSKFIWR